MHDVTKDHCTSENHRDQDDDARIDRSLEWWHSCAAQSPKNCPSGKDLWNSPLRGILPGAALFVRSDPKKKLIERQYVCLFSGRLLNEIIGADYTGHYFGKLADPRFLPIFRQQLTHVIETVSPIEETISLPRASFLQQRIRRAVLPLVDRRTVGKVLLVIERSP